VSLEKVDTSNPALDSLVSELRVTAPSLLCWNHSCMQVDFMASWCGKCRMISPAVEALQREYPNVTFYKFDISNPALDSLASELGVTALPVFKFYRAGKEVVEQVVGYKKKPLQNAVKALSNNS
jgi:thiol-disulfide isomerase/thioredoxin